MIGFTEDAGSPVGIAVPEVLREVRVGVTGSKDARRACTLVTERGRSAGACCGVVGCVGCVGCAGWGVGDVVRGRG